MANYIFCSIPEFMDYRYDTNLCGLIGFYKTFGGYWDYLHKFPDLPDPLEEFQKR